MKQTCTTMFLVPCLGLNVEYLRTYGFINGYLNDKEGYLYPNAVYLLFQPDNMGHFQGFLGKEYDRAGTLIIDEYDYAGGYVVLVYKIPEHFGNDYKHFLKGRYSKFSKRFVGMLPQEKSDIDAGGIPFTETSLQVRICTKSKALREYRERQLDVVIEDDMELWDKPSMIKETLNIQKIINEQ